MAFAYGQLSLFIIARLSKALSCAAEMKKILQADLDMDLNVPKFNVLFPGTSFSLVTARSALERAVRANPSLADLSAMGGQQHRGRMSSV